MYRYSFIENKKHSSANRSLIQEVWVKVQDQSSLTGEAFANILHKTSKRKFKAIHHCNEDASRQLGIRKT
jgi:hypothetical protein